MRRFLAPPLAIALLAALTGAAAAAPQSIEQRITHPDGVSLQLQSIEFRDALIVLTAMIANPGEREISLNRGHGFVLDDGAHGTYHLSPPADNPELRIPPRTQAKAELIFIGPLASAARRLTLSTNRGIGTRDNPYDDAPLLEATLPLDGRGAAAGGIAASHPNGTAVLLRRLVAGPTACVASLIATNGNDRTIVLNQDRSLVLTDSSGNAAALRPPTENRELVVPAGNRLDADLVFDCRGVDPGGGLSLVTNWGTGGTADNPYDATPVLTLKGPAERSDATPTESRANVTPIARSHVFDTTTVAAAGPPLTAPGPAAPPPSPPPASAAPASSLPPLPDAGKPAAPPPPREAAKPAGAGVVMPKTLPQLEAALHAETTDRGLRLVIPADSLFAEHQATLDEAAPPLPILGALVAAMQPREIVVIGHTDSVGEDAANLTLSKEQAHAVAAWLAAHAPKQRPHVIEQAYGRTRPVAPNHNADGSDNKQGRGSNRRLEILLRRH